MGLIKNNKAFTHGYIYTYIYVIFNNMYELRKRKKKKQKVYILFYKSVIPFLLYKIS